MEIGNQSEVQTFPLTLALLPLLTGLLSQAWQQRKGSVIMLLFGIMWWGFSSQLGGGIICKSFCA